MDGSFPFRFVLWGISCVLMVRMLKVWECLLRWVKENVCRFMRELVFLFDNAVKVLLHNFVRIAIHYDSIICLLELSDTVYFTACF
jgi:hypothetical protein